MTSSTAQSTTTQFVESLRRGTGAQVFVAADGVPEGRPTLFNGAYTAEPLAVAACRTAEEVSRSLGVAEEYGMPVSVLAGGHDMAGRAICEGGLVIDLRPMCSVHVNTAAGEVTIGGGALMSDLLRELPPEWVTVTGTIRSVGMTGFALGCGYGRLNSRCGLAIDCLKRAEVVLANGRVVTASLSENAELFWALRGGGSGFGVVTSVTMAIFLVPSVLTAAIFFPLGSAKQALLRMQESLDQGRDELSIFAAFMTPPGGEVGLLLAPMWSGDAAAGERALGELTGLEGAMVMAQGWSAYRDTFDEETEKAWPKGRHYQMETQTISRMDERTATMLVEGAKRMSSPKSGMVLHDFHGAAARVAADTTAFPLRRNHFVVEAVAAWDPSAEDDGARHRRWASELSRELSTAALPGGYVNLLNPEESDRVRLFYGGTAERLLAVKRRVDPTDVFRSSTGHFD